APAAGGDNDGAAAAGAGGASVSAVTWRPGATGLIAILVVARHRPGRRRPALTQTDSDAS
ncbi:MAG: hypothetical protein ACK49G_11440, partial [Brevundimonas sp.]|uniref:hypothetical protein n=1 Tax=Brevundimonas sp. TaxID=1871086 RepID=UPI00391B94AF